MQDTSTVDLLIDMARKKRDDAAQALAGANARHQEHGVKMRLLETYLAEYHERQRGLAATNVLVLANFHAFLAKLEVAVSQQRVELAASAQRTVVKREQWEKALRHCKSMELVQQRRVQVERGHAARAQQKHHDELAARLSRQPMGMAFS